MRKVNEERLQRTLNFIIAFQREEGRTPTQREIESGCGYSSRGSVSADIARLKSRGQLTSEKINGWNRISIPVNLEVGSYHKASILGCVRCGQPSPAVEDIEATVALPDEIFGKGEHMLLYAKGPSMIKRGIFDGDLLVVQKNPSPKEGETVVALVNGDETTCKVFARDGKRKYLRAANDAVDDKGRRIYDVYPKGEWSIIGVVDYVIHAPISDEL